MFFLIYSTMLTIYVRWVSVPLMRHWALHDEVIVHMVVLVVCAALARLLQAVYAAYNTKYYRRTMTARYFQRLSN